MPSSSRSPRSQSPFTSVIWVSLIAIAAGLFVLPRLQPGNALTGLSGGTEPAPDFTLPVIHGGELDSRLRLSALRGKLVLLDFWASWCQPCREQAKVLRAVAGLPENRDLEIVGINVSDQPDAARRYLKADAPPWVVVEDPEGVANSAYSVETLPTLVAVNADGKLFTVRRRFVPERELNAILEGMRSQARSQRH
ncbi:MAG TPA: TlpA disulfide reductase family protein [Polyangiaceae bacterium]|nr:TlpA disulfide reductase family protein [Polyangiaceae bacterium]